jgi:methylglyoxal reductase
MPWYWLGTWSLGGEHFGKSDGREVLAMLQQAIHSGFCHFDSALFYAHGRSIDMLSKILKNRRQDLFIVAKGGLSWQGKRVIHRADALTLRQTLHDTLKRLGTDYLDCYQLHWPDPNIPLEESIHTLKALQTEGLIRYWGVANLPADTLTQHIPMHTHIPHQVHFNPLVKSHDILTAGHQQQRCLNCITSPLEQGLLSTFRKTLNDLGKKDFRRKNRLFHNASIQQWRKDLEPLQKQSDVPLEILALLWILSFNTVDAIIPGPRSRQQLLTLMTLTDWMEKLSLHWNQRDDWSKKLEQQVGNTLWKHLNNAPNTV